MKKTQFTAFRARRRLTLNVRDWSYNESGRIVVEKGTSLTRDKNLLELLRSDYGDVVEIDERRQNFDRAAPISDWPKLKDFKGRVLIVTPSHAIGDCAMTLCAMAALMEAGPALDLGIAFVGQAYPVFQWDRRISVHPYLLHESELQKYQGVIDLYNIAAWDGQVYKPFDFEGEFLAALKIPPSARLSSEGRPLRDPTNPMIRLFPQATTPVRGIPPETTIALARSAAEFGRVEVVLNPYQIETKP